MSHALCCGITTGPTSLGDGNFFSSIKILWEHSHARGPLLPNGPHTRLKSCCTERDGIPDSQYIRLSRQPRSVPVVRSQRLFRQQGGRGVSAGGRDLLPPPLLEFHDQDQEMENPVWPLSR